MVQTNAPFLKIFIFKTIKLINNLELISSLKAKSDISYVYIFIIIFKKAFYAINRIFNIYIICEKRFLILIIELSIIIIVFNYIYLLFLNINK